MNATIRTRTDKNLMDANHQWATRPADERYIDRLLFRDAMYKHKRNALSATSTIADLRCEAVDGEVVILGRAGVPAPMTHWAFGQIASTAGAPAGYLRKLPAKLAAECLATGLRQAENPDTVRKLLLRKDADAVRLHAATGEGYARIWNAEIADCIVDFCDAHPTWSNPEAFRSMSGSVNWGERAILPCAFGGDRDCFVFLCDYTKTVKVPGQDHPLARGFFLENSEVGDGSVRLTMFLFDGVCSNMIIWATQEIREVRMRHVGSVRDRFLPADGAPMLALRAFSEASAREDEARIVKAMRTVVADNLDDARKRIVAKQIPGITGAAVSAAYEIAASEPRYGNPLSLWGLVSGLTEHSQKTAYAGDRVALDRAAGRLLEIQF